MTGPKMNRRHAPNPLTQQTFPKPRRQQYLAARQPRGGFSIDPRGSAFSSRARDCGVR